ncbi:MAG TPA: VTT domain-containing protein [Candidatus Angelobacter sp.]|jgi:membrane protein YqaA with SNARE-associated domain|nr:VTT domain-containing protein [Candidatus Angelobacter sp.]
MGILLLVTWWSWLERLGGAGLILLALADNSVVPLPGSMDVLTVILSAHQKDWWPYYALMATLGGITGGYVTYALGRKGGKEALEKKLPKQKAKKIYEIFNRHGFWSLLLPAVLPPPVPFSPFLVAAGALQYSRRKFFVAVGLGRAIRYNVLAYLGSKYSRQILGFFKDYYQPILWTFVGLSVSGGIAAAIYVWKRKREGKPVIPGPTTNQPAKAA